MNFSGAAFHSESGVWADHAPSNMVSAGWELGGNIMNVPGFLEDAFIDEDHPNRQAVIDDVISMVVQVLSPFDVQVVTHRPPIDDFTMIAVGGRWGHWLNVESCTILGQATMDCEESNPSNIGIMASECLFDNLGLHGKDGRTILAHVILHEAAHTWGLQHNQTDGSIMCVTCANFNKSLEWGTGPVLEDGYNTCGTNTQDDFAILMEHLGPHADHQAIPASPDDTPPSIEWVRPVDGQGVGEHPKACLSASDASGIQAVFLQAIAVLEDGSSIFLGTQTKTEPPYVFDDLTVSADPTVQIVYRFLVLDRWDNMTEQRVTPVYDPAAGPVDCP